MTEVMKNYQSFQDRNGVDIPMDWRLTYAEQQIFNTYEDKVSVVQKLKPLTKWGRNEAVGTARATIMTLAASVTQETFLTTDTALAMSSSSANDTTQTLNLFEGHTSSGDDLTFVVAANTGLTLNGQSAVPLTNLDRTRISRARMSLPVEGDIYFYEAGTSLSGGVPTDLTKVHMMIPAGEIQTQKASTSISSTDYYIITNWSAGVLEKTAAYAQARIEIRPWTDDNTDSWYPITKWLAIESGSGRYGIGEHSPYLIVPKNHDVRMSAIAGAAGIDIVGGIEGFLANIITT